MFADGTTLPSRGPSIEQAVLTSAFAIVNLELSSGSWRIGCSKMTTNLNKSFLL